MCTLVAQYLSTLTRSSGDFKAVPELLTMRWIFCCSSIYLSYQLRRSVYSVA